MNKAVRSKLMTNDLFEYDIALSFAGEDKAIAEEFTNLLRAKNVKVLCDESQTAELGGSDFVTHIAELYRTKARYCVLFISGHYPLKKWTAAERTSAREHALRDADECILPIRLDDSDVPGIAETTGYRDLRHHSLESIVHLIEEKLAQTKGRSSPPSQSHDLRSGNIPTQQNESNAISAWYCLSLGDGMIASGPSEEIEERFRQSFISAGRPSDMAVFTRPESEGRLHCEVMAYFSPAAAKVATVFDAQPCEKPERAGLSLLAGEEGSWSELFPESAV
jgi:hypothetical protein